MHTTLRWESQRLLAKGWLVIDKLVNGVSGGGIFMHQQATEQEVAELACHMSMKNQLNDIPFGGAKAGIQCNPNSPHTQEILKEFLYACKPYLLSQWSTGGDLNTTSEMIEATLKYLNINSSFLAIGNMYATKFGIENQCQHLRARVCLPINRYFNLEQGIVGYSISSAIASFLTDPLKMFIQGFGQIGASLAYFSEQLLGAKVVGISDVSGTLLCQEGLSIETLLAIRKKYGPQLNLVDLFKYYQREQPGMWLANQTPFTNQNLLEGLKVVRADIVSFCANRYAITKEVLSHLVNYTYSDSKLKWLVCGANLPFAQARLEQKAKSHNIFYIPSWITSSGNSLLYAQALSLKQINTYWVQHILEHISNIVLQQIKNILSTEADSNETKIDRRKSIGMASD